MEQFLIENIEQHNDNGTAIKRAKPVIESVPTTIGKTPYCPLVGAHVIPNIKLIAPYDIIAGSPSRNMKAMIRMIINMEDIPVAKSTHRINFSSFFSVTSTPQ